jgi:hypothetical protein
MEEKVYPLVMIFLHPKVKIIDSYYGYRWSQIPFVECRKRLFFMPYPVVTDEKMNLYVLTWNS